MHFWLLTNLRTSPSTELVLSTSDELGLAATHIVPSAQSYDLTATSLEDLFSDKSFSAPDFCFIRMGSAADAEGFALVSKIQSLGLPCVNDPKDLILLRDKAQGLSALSAAGIPVPRTLVVGKEYRLDEILARLGKPPWIVKTRFSTKGLGVVLVESERSLRSVLDTLLASHSQLLVQEFVSENSGTDIRVIVAFGRVVGAMKRGAGDSNEFRSNLFLGGEGVPFEVSEELSDLAIRATQAVNLTIAGVDILGESGNYKIAEVNTSPGLAGASQVMGKNLAQEILSSFKQMYS